MSKPSLLRALFRHPLLRPLRLARLNWIARHHGHQDWTKILTADRTTWDRTRSEGGQRVLIATGTGGHFPVAAIDRLLSVALTLRGGNVKVALCDGTLDACQRCEVNLFPRLDRFAETGPAHDLCASCYRPATRQFDATGITTVRYGAYHPDADRRKVVEILSGIRSVDEAINLHWDGITIGEHASAGALRFFGRATLDGEEHGRAVLLRYLAAALRTAMIAKRMIEAERPDVVVLHHGIYVPQGVFAETAKRMGTRVVTWSPAYRRHCFLFAHEDTYHRTLMTEDNDSWANTKLSPAQSEQIDRYLRSRRTGTNDWIYFHKPRGLHRARALEAIGLAPDKPLILALTNVMWDAQLHYDTNAFGSQLQWLEDTVRWFATRPDLQLVIRVHPAELTGHVPSRQKIVHELARLFPALPANVIVIPPDSSVSTYDLASKADTALIYATKTGVELAALGLPVIVAGEAWVRNKGVTFDVPDRDTYFSYLDTLPHGERLPSDVIDRARRYAYHFFFRRMIPLEMVEKVDGPRTFTVTSTGLGPLQPGASAGLDAICNGILRGVPFHMREDILSEAAEAFSQGHAISE